MEQTYKTKPCAHCGCETPHLNNACKRCGLSATGNGHEPNLQLDVQPGATSNGQDPDPFDVQIDTTAKLDPRQFQAPVMDEQHMRELGRRIGVMQVGIDGLKMLITAAMQTPRGDELRSLVSDLAQQFIARSMTDLDE